RLMEIANANAKQPAAFEALKWIVAQGPESDGGREALAILARDHIGNEGLGEVADRLRYSDTPASEAFLRLVMRESPHESARGRATYALAHVVRGKAGLVRTLKDKDADPDELKYARTRAGD